MPRRRRIATQWIATLATLLALGSCGNDSETGPQVPADLTGPWNLYLTWSGSPGEDSPLHVTLTQSRSSLSMAMTCRADVPAATGTRSGDDIHLTWDLGQGGIYVLAGTVSTAGASGSISQVGGGSLGAWRLVPATLLNCDDACDSVVVVRFVTTDFADLAKVETISRFRSSAGHSFADDCEPCRSMKHYYAPYAAYRTNGTVEIRSPVDGTISEIAAEGYGDRGERVNKQVHVRCAAHPAYTFRLFHVDLLSAQIVAGKSVTAGEQLGWARMVQESVGQTSHDFDIAIEVHTPFGERLVSYFDIMTDGLFAAYRARGAQVRSDFVITKQGRDGDPLGCDGESFTSTGSLPAWFGLNPVGP